MSNRLKFGLPVKAEGLVQMDCRDVFTFWDDFLESSMSVTADIARWKSTLYKAETVPALLDGTDASQELAGGIVAVTVGATDSGAANMLANGESFQIGPGHELYFESRFLTTHVGTSCFVGLTNFDTTSLDATHSAIVTGGINGIGFKTVGTTLYTSVAKTSLNDDSIAGITIAADTWYRVAFHYDGGTAITFYFATGDGELVEVNQLHLTTSGHYIPNDIMLTPTIEAENQDGEGIMYVDYVLCQQARQRVAD